MPVSFFIFCIDMAHTSIEDLNEKLDEGGMGRITQWVTRQEASES